MALSPMERHLLCNSSSLLLLFLFSSVPITSQFPFGSSKQAYHHSNVTCIESERRALLQLKHGLKDELNRLSSWIGEGCCSWEGVGCHKTTGSVLKLDLHGIMYDDYHCTNCLGGQLSPSLVNLTNLRYLDMSSNNFSGIQLPAFLGLLKNLRYLNLSHAGFDGEIPHHLGNLSHLRYLDLGWNSLSTKDLGWVAGLSSLEGLVLSKLNLAAAQDGLQSINMLLSLTTLDLNGCDLFIHPHLSHVNFTSLAFLDLSGNNFNNYMAPPWLRNLTGLHDLRLVEGLVLSTVSVIDARDGLQSINMLPSLTTLDLNGCGHFIHPHLSHVNFTSLAFLDLVVNNFNNNMVPSWLCNLTGLHDLRFGNNNLYDPIHGLFDQMTSLVYLDLSPNRFDASTLKSLCNASSLTYLDLSDNNLQGSIASEIGQLINLTYLDLSGNNVQGSIPSEIGQLPKLTRLLLSSNKLNGTIPINLGQLTKLQDFDVGDNSLTGVLSEDHFTKLRELKSLDLTGNSLALNVSSSWIPPFQLREIQMQSIIVGPRFPAWLRTQKGLGVLDMRKASISDAIPNWFLSKNKSSTVRSWLYLSQNFLTGHIPQLHHALSILYLNDNRFTGTIPEDLCKLENLYILDLSNNLLSGRVPLCLGNLRDLKLLKLANNSLSGQIPISLGLRVLNLAHNNLSGFIPHCFNNISAMMVSGPDGLYDIYGQDRLQDIKGGREDEFDSGDLRLLRSETMEAIPSASGDVGLQNSATVKNQELWLQQEVKNCCCGLTLTNLHLGIILSTTIDNSKIAPPSPHKPQWA
ncbi:receptor-like protein EIX1 [Coffea eugenioides]|uniref:receptor-like protein EIX1 n=1 Tax=Coffea eugenioides TaxID=49369 RepID=UPI000F6095A6|nr:receptor-like protein EIX1 [Coffea eugenioides]